MGSKKSLGWIEKLMGGVVLITSVVALVISVKTKNGWAMMGWYMASVYAAKDVLRHIKPWLEKLCDSRRDNG